ncbi:tRNA pseudouridine synthase Pus10 [Aricia agestis]|uniref:tRNA pseudouridine synthase Pus10 n=1 Tax=Aricia agestis TaxID=91739 RepID=UPI001C205AA5|nr:tRNA pseudouridine synthase Pus10 [Aricia agestis]
MDQKAIFTYCQSLGCCKLCCLRYAGIKNRNAYEKPNDFCKKFENVNGTEQDQNMDSEPKEGANGREPAPENSTTHNNKSNGNGDEALSENSNGNGCPAPKRRKMDVCASCLGILQEQTWSDSVEMTKEVLEKKRYECKTFACALSAPIATILREKAIMLRLIDKYPEYSQQMLIPLKEAWKWSFGVYLESNINKTLDSGAISPLLITVNMDYIDDLQELEILKTVSPELFEERSKQKRRFVTEFTRRSVEQALENATLPTLVAAGGALPVADGPAHTAGVQAAHAPAYLAARYVKLSRNLPQSPWVLEGRRVLPSSVQEIIFAPIAKLYKFDADAAESRLKFVAAGREDVDVRCLGDGRPFAVEVTDPTRELTAAELERVCEEISQSGDVVVTTFQPITRDDLVQLKKGEETKCKTYEALCIKLSHRDDENLPEDAPITVTDSDIERMNAFRNTAAGDVIKLNIQQKTPIRVLHRRPLLTRTRQILDFTAEKVPGQQQLFKIRVRTSAGTYVKEWVHGEYGRTQPSLGEAIGARVDMLALDVTAVHLDWPPNKS